MRTHHPLLLTCLLVLAVPTMAFAHPGHAHQSGFGEGLIHPFSGLDHLIALLATAILGLRLGGRAAWGIPALFLASCSLGGMIALAGYQLPLATVAIVLSAIVSVALLLRRQNPSTAAVATLALFGVFHGQAHLQSLASQPANVAGYAAGVLLASLTIIAIPVALARLSAFARTRSNSVSASLENGRS